MHARSGDRVHCDQSDSDRFARLLPIAECDRRIKFQLRALPERTPGATDGADIRIDWTISAKQSVYARFSRKNITASYANPLLPDDVDGIHNRSLLASHTYSMTPKLLNEFRFGFTNVTTAVNFAIVGADALKQLDLQGVNISQHPTTHAFPTFNFSNGTGFTPVGRDKTGVTQSKTLQWTDNVTWSKGRHTLKGGIDLRRVRYFDIETFLPSDDFGQFDFNTTFTGNAFGDFLIGAPTTSYFAVSSPDVGGTTWQYGLFAQDEYQVNSRLTLIWSALDGAAALLPRRRQRGELRSTHGCDCGTGSVEQLPDPEQSASFEPGFSAVVQRLQFAIQCDSCAPYLTASQDHLPNGLRNTYYGNWQPRIGIAYRPFNDTKTVVRAGFGVFTMTNLGPLSFNNSGNPTSNLHTYANSMVTDAAARIR
jgi:hypothetical protein